MKKCFWIIIVLILLVPSLAKAETIEAKNNLQYILGLTLEGDLNPRLNELIVLFKKGLEREKLKAYDSALAAYKQCALISYNILNSNYLDQRTTDIVVPFAAAAAYRKVLVSQRLIEERNAKLYDQLKIYEDNDSWINEILTTISNLKVVNSLNIPATNFGMLYFAKAYNRLGWSYALLNGNLWKRYVVYTPSAIAKMAINSMGDLKEFFSIYNISLENTEADAKKYLSRPFSLSENLLFRLCYGVNDLEKIKEAFKKQFKDQASVAYNNFKSANTVRVLKDAEQLQTFEDILNNPKIKDFIKTVRDILDQLS